MYFSTETEFFCDRSGFDCQDAKCNNRIQLFEDDNDILFSARKWQNAKSISEFCLQIQSSHHCTTMMGGKQIQNLICNNRYILLHRTFCISCCLTVLPTDHHKVLSLPKICSNIFFCLWHERKRYQKNPLQFPLLSSFLIPYHFLQHYVPAKRKRKREREREREIDR